MEFWLLGNSPGNSDFLFQIKTFCRIFFFFSSNFFGNSDFPFALCGIFFFFFFSFWLFCLLFLTFLAISGFWGAFWLFFPQNYVFWKFWPILGIVTNWILSFFKDFFFFFFRNFFFSFFLKISLFVGFWLFFNFDIFWNFDLFSKSWSCWELKFFFLLDFWLSFS